MTSGERDEMSMKKILCAALGLGLALSLSACGESMVVPTEPTQTEPLWAMSPEDRPSQPTDVAMETTEAMETTQATEETEETEATTEAATVSQETEPLYPMEEKFTPAEGTYFVKKGVNCRDQANVNSHVVAVLQAGQEVLRVGISQDGWTAILWEDTVRYVSTDYLVSEKPADAPASGQEEEAMDDQVYTNHAVNMREGPGMDRAVLVKIPEYTEVHRIGSTASGWYKVEYKDKVGYVNGAYIMPKYVDSEEHPAETVVDENVQTTREVNLRKGPGTDRQILDRVPEGTQVHRIATTSNEWSKVEYGGQVGYISSKYLETVIVSEG